MLGKHYNNSILIINPKTKNRIANSGLTNYIKEMAIDEDEVITEENHITAEKLVYYLIIKKSTIYIVNQDAGLINTLLTNDNNHKRDLKTESNLI